MRAEECTILYNIQLVPRSSELKDNIQVQKKGQLAISSIRLETDVCLAKINYLYPGSVPHIVVLGG